MDELGTVRAGPKETVGLIAWNVETIKLAEISDVRTVLSKQTVAMQVEPSANKLWPYRSNL